MCEESGGTEKNRTECAIPEARAQLAASRPSPHPLLGHQALLFQSWLGSHTYLTQ